MRFAAEVRVVFEGGEVGRAAVRELGEGDVDRLLGSGDLTAVMDEELSNRIHPLISAA